MANLTTGQVSFTVQALTLYGYFASHAFMPELLKLCRKPEDVVCLSLCRFNVEPQEEGGRGWEEWTTCLCCKIKAGQIEAKANLSCFQQQIQ